MLGFLIVLVVLPTVITHLFFWRMETRIGLNVHHRPLFSLVPGSVRLDDASADFKDYLQITSGTADIRYPLTWLLQSRIPISIEARNLAVRPGDELREALGNEPVVFDRVSAKLVLGAGRKIDIEYLNAESKTIQFHLGVKNPHER